MNVQTDKRTIHRMFYGAGRYYQNNIFMLKFQI